MNTIDLSRDLKHLLNRHPVLAKLADPLSAFFARVVAAVGDFESNDDANLGHLEESLKEPSGELAAAVLREAGQRKANACPPNCPDCGKKLKRRQQTERGVTAGRSQFRIKRLSGYCGKCQRWACPADLQLGIESGYTPPTEAAAALVASKMPLAEASAVLDQTSGIRIPPATLDRLVKRVGEKALLLRNRQDQTARAGGPAFVLQAVKTPPETLVIMLDAWNIRERDDWGRTEKLRRKGEPPKRWHWVWTGTVFGLDQRTEKSGRAIITARGYVSTREGQESFAQQLHAEALRQGLGRCKRVLIMGDGAAWIWNLAADRFAQAVQRVDLYHVKQHLWVAAKELFPDQPQTAKAWVKKMKNRLCRGLTGKVISSLEQAVEEAGSQRREPLEKELAYLKDNQARMGYADAEQRGEPLGTGAIESTCRQYQCRFKRPGQFWTQKGDEALMSLETHWRNGRWHWLFPHVQPADLSKN